MRGADIIGKLNNIAKKDYNKIPIGTELLIPVGELNYDYEVDELYKELLVSRSKESPSEASGWDIFWMYWMQKNPWLEKIEGDDLSVLGEGALVDWRVEHLEELAEDACSTLVFGNVTYDILVKVFTDHYDVLDQPDMRHPAPSLRLEVTYQLLKLMDVSFEPGTEDPIKSEHNKIPGAKELAQWIFTNKSKLVKEDLDQSLLEGVKQELNSFAGLYGAPKPSDELNQFEALTSQSAWDEVKTVEELDLQVFARIDPNAYTSHAQASWWRRVTYTIRGWLFR